MWGNTAAVIYMYIYVIYMYIYMYIYTYISVWQSFTLSIVTFTEINKTSGLFGKQEYFPHLQLFIVLHVTKRLFS